MKKIFALLNTPADSIYGASKSFRTHVKLLENDYYFTIISQASLRRKTRIGSHFGLGVSTMPNVLGFSLHARENISTFFKFCLGLAALPIILYHAKTANIIHLNSITLLHYARLFKFFFPRKKIVCHVREVEVRFRNINKFFARFVDEFIFIDKDVLDTASFLGQNHKTHILENPVLIENSSEIFSFDTREVNIGVVGRLAPEKNILSVLKMIHEERFRCILNIKFHFVGGAGANKTYHRRCLEKIETSPLCVYHGEVRELENTNFFSNLDGILRFDNHYSIGRSILEALHFDLNIYTQKDIFSKLSKRIDGLQEGKFQSLETSKNFIFSKVNRRDGSESTKLLNVNYLETFKRIYA